jgi:hypothetical protein
MRSALARTDSNVVAVKIAAAVPMSVIKRMFHFLIGIRNSDRPEFLETNDHYFYAAAETQELNTRTRSSNPRRGSN